MNKDKTLMLLKNERLLQVKREGVPLKFQQGYGLSLPYFQYKPEYATRLAQLFSNRKYPLQLCFYDGTPFGPIYHDKLFFKSEQICQLYLNDRAWASKLQQGTFYYLVKNNATLGILQKVHDNIDNINKDIYKYINEQATQMPANPIWDGELDQSWTQGLNKSQYNSIVKMLTYPLTFVKGPPGCGKTKTIARMSRVMTSLGCKVLVGAASNTAIKTIAKQIIDDFYETQIYHPSITLFFYRETQQQNIQHPPELRVYTLRYKLLESFFQINKNPNINEDVVNFYLDQSWTTSNYIPPPAFYAIYRQALSYVIHNTQLMVSTTISAALIDNKLNAGDSFDPYIGILDEAAQTSWADSLCFLTQGIQKLVLVGDEKQLTPTVISQTEDLKKTIFTSLMDKRQQYFTLLDTQYRMHPKIAEFPNLQFYGSQLKDGVTIKDRTSSIPYFSKYPVSFIHHTQTQSKGQQQSLAHYYFNGFSKSKKNYTNFQQICIMSKILQLFRKEDLRNVGIITPYIEQLHFIKQQFKELIDIYCLTAKTCDGYQGGQKDYIIVSCVRSNSQNKLGFCKQQNRLNVTLTRARRGLILIGNSETLQNGKCYSWTRYIEYLKSNNLILSEKQFLKSMQELPKRQENLTQFKQQKEPELKNEQPKKDLNKQLQTFCQQKMCKYEQQQMDDLFHKKKNKSKRVKISQILQQYRLTLKKIVNDTPTQIQKQTITNLQSSIQNEVTKDIKYPQCLTKITEQMYAEIKQYLTNNEHQRKQILEQLNRKKRQSMSRIQELKQFNGILQRQLIFQVVRTIMLIKILTCLQEQN